jgi:hypothetical protein
MSERQKASEGVDTELLFELLGGVVGARNRFAENSDMLNKRAALLKRNCEARGEDPGEDPTISFMSGQITSLLQVTEILDMALDGHNLRRDPAAAGLIFRQILGESQQNDQD